MRLRVPCPSCGLVEVDDVDVELLAERAGGEPAWYAFDCPSCSATVRSGADARLLRALAYIGARVRVAPPDQLAAEDADVAGLRRLLDEPDFVQRLGGYS
jgi:hypothetical protein